MKHDAVADRGRKAKAKYAVPIAVTCVALLMGTLLMFPMLKMEPRDVPVALLSLDRGVEAGGQYVNVGDMVIGELTGEPVDGGDWSDDSDGADGADGGDETDGAEDIGFAGLTMGSDASSGYVSGDSVDWIVAESQEQLDDLMGSGQCYASMTIPSGFSEYVIANAAQSEIGAQLVDKLPDLASGANALDAGAGSLADGAAALSDGASSLSSGADKLQSGVSGLPAGVDAAQSGAVALEGGLAKLEVGAHSLGDGASSLQSGVAQVQQAVDEAIASLSSDNPNVQHALALLSGASQGAAKLDEGAGSIAAGASSLADGISASRSGAESLGAGLSGLSEGASSIVSGVDALASGAASLDSGTSSVVEGSQAISDGSASLASGLNTANDALGQLPAGSDDDSIKLVINQGKNPMVSNSLGSAISSLGASSGMAFDISYINPLPEEMSTGFAHMILMILTYIASYATAAVIANTFKLRHGSRRSLLLSVAVQVGYAALCALVVGVGAWVVLTLATGADILFGNLALFVAVASFSFQMLVIGSLDLLGAPGMVVPIGLLVMGMGTAYLPTEFLPAFWQDWVYPWDPLRFMVDGFKGILYMGQGFWSASTAALLVLVLIGAALIGVRAALDLCGQRKRQPS